VQKYNLNWPDGADPLEIEFAMIRRDYGKPSTVQHYLKAHSLLWPEDKQHRWFELGMAGIVENQVTVILGCANASKTYLMSCHALIDFWCFPETSLALISSTDIRSLELRIWGRGIKWLFNRGRSRFPWLPGHILESKMAIVSDDIDEDGEFARQIDRGIVCVPCVSGGRFVGMSKFQGVKAPSSPGKNDGILKHYGDECFPAGTLVDTPHGKRPIESIRTGDLVFSAVGASRVIATMKRAARNLVRIKISNGKEIVCTPEHPVLTQFGWKKAFELDQGCVMITAHEANQILSGKEMSPLWGFNPAQSDVLRAVLQREVVRSATGLPQETLHAGAFPKDSESSQEAVCGAAGALCGYAGEDGARVSGFPRFTDGQTEVGNQSQYKQAVEGGGSQAYYSRRKWNRADEGRIDSPQNILSASQEQFSSQNENASGERLPDALQSGCCISEKETGGGIRRSITQHDCAAGARREENEFSSFAWVDSVEICEQASHSDAADCEGRTSVYNLAVAGHPSYSVNGFLVHNCAVMQPSLLDGYTNWMANSRFKGVMAGNPTDISDPLCVASEPPGGWDTFIDNGKTQVWRSRWLNAFCVAYDGRDTPNNDEPKDSFPFLANSGYVQKLIDTYGADSWQVYQQGIGKPSRGMVSNRVITIGLCERHGAFKSAIWKGTPRTKIYALDPAYGGGDRCVGGECEFGEDKDGNLIFSVGTPEIIPIRLNSSLDAEDQIAEFIKQQSERLDLKPENIFYDSFGRGTLGNSFAKVFGASCPQPVDSGARTTTRPVRFDLFVDEKEGEKRLKRCDEHYSKFVTEMWFSTREAIESNQVRNLPANVAQEGQLRLFKVVAGNKVEVESKDDMKERVKKSPDLYDWFAIAIEGARRMGFKIERIGRDVKSNNADDEDYFDKEVKEWDDAIQAGLLKH
jgi:hypothetical protein